MTQPKKPQVDPLTIKQLIDGNPNVESITEYTCYDCPLWQECPFAFDAYNTDGDCLAIK